MVAKGWTVEMSSDVYVRGISFIFKIGRGDDTSRQLVISAAVNSFVLKVKTRLSVIVSRTQLCRVFRNAYMHFWSEYCNI